jgi:hypothetical protein
MPKFRRLGIGACSRQLSVGTEMVSIKPMKTCVLPVLFLFTILSSSFGFAQEEKDTSASAGNQKRAYPGGRDEEDLKVQESLPTPTALADRRSIEQKVLKNYFKKADEEAGTKPKNQ